MSRVSRVSLCYPSAGRPGGLTYSGVMAWLCDGGHPDARTYAYEVQGAKAFEDMPRSNVPGQHLPPLATSPYPATHPYLATALTLLHLLPGALSGTSRTLLMAAANEGRIEVTETLLRFED